MREIDKKKIGKVLLLMSKVVLAIPLTVIFIVIRGIQFFLKMCGAVVSFVCIVSAVMLSIGVLVEIVLQINGNGPGIPAIILTMAVAGGLAYIPAAGVAMVMVVLEAVCSWIWKWYMGNSDNWKAFYKRPDYQWSAFEGGYKGKDTDDTEFHIHYFKGIKSQEELKKRYYALLRIYHPDNSFGEDEITRSIMEEYDYLKNKFPKEESV
ncbi:MAG: hypothetical protein Q4C84_03520 [Bacillota bacterium]|nr:hypothetical protein [Bacillota bacterium]